MCNNLRKEVECYMGDQFLCTDWGKFRSREYMPS